MKRRVFINYISAFSLALTVDQVFAQNKEISRHLNSDAVVRISKKNALYFELSNGEPYIVSGPCLSGAPDMETMEGYLKKLAENGGNFARVWLCHRLFEVEQKYGEFSEEKAENISKLLKLASRYNIKLKFCLENTRQILPEKNASFNKPQYHTINGGPFTHVDEYINTPEGRAAYLNRAEFLRERYAGHPAIFGWELWNEMNGIMCKGLHEWNDYMLPQMHKKFPQSIVLQSLGSFDMNERRPDYKYINSLSSNDVAQIHRYIDAGAKLEVCMAPMDILAADAIDELRSYGIKKPMLLAEVGAVLPNHTGSSELYPLDIDGTLLHDMIFTPFFCGAAGTGNSWHWDKYIDRNDLWYHFARFKAAVTAINPLEENFKPLKLKHDNLRIYLLSGKNTILAWCRDISSDWRAELIEGKKAKPITDQSIDFSSLISSDAIKKASFYDPWQNKWSEAPTNQVFELPDFKRSLVIKIEKFK